LLLYTAMLTLLAERLGVTTTNTETTGVLGRGGIQTVRQEEQDTRRGTYGTRRQK
jgi:hypothetical protein